MEGLQVFVFALMLGVVQPSNCDSLDNYIQNLEKKYEARFQALEEKFSADLTAMKAEFNIKEQEYISRIEALETAIGTSTDSSETSVEDSTAKTTNMSTVVLNSDGVNAHPKLSESGSKKTRSQTGRKRQIAVQTNEKIAFFASMDKDVTNLGANQDIVFDKVVTNLGSAYNRYHGTFVAPVPGTYVFFSTLYQGNSLETYGHFMINDVIIAKIDVRTAGRQSSQSVIAILNKGDSVAIQSGRAGTAVHGGMFSTFGGFLLFANGADGSEIVGK